VNFPILKPFFNRTWHAVSSAKTSRGDSSNALPDTLRLGDAERQGKTRRVHKITGLDTAMSGSEEDVVQKRTPGEWK
jgi:hypothetical protein